MQQIKPENNIERFVEAQEYYRHPVLGPRLREITGVLLTHKGKSAEQIFGPIDAVKLRSSMTLFHSATGDFQFDMVLYHFFDEQRCEKTLAILAEERRKALSSLP